jgi:hypothetical protein
MTQIILTEEQTKVLDQARAKVQICDARGNVVTFVDANERVSAEEIAEAKRRLASPQPGVPSHQVEAHLRALEAEWQRTGGFDEAYMRSFLQRLRSGQSA